MDHIWHCVILGSYCEVLVKIDPRYLFSMGIEVSPVGMVNTILRVTVLSPTTQQLERPYSDQLLWADMCEKDREYGV